MRCGCLILTLLLALLPACHTRSGETGSREYRPYCVTERKPLGPWTAEKSEADAAIREHTRLFHWHTTRINIHR